MTDQVWKIVLRRADGVLQTRYVRERPAIMEGAEVGRVSVEDERVMLIRIARETSIKARWEAT